MAHDPQLLQRLRDAGTALQRTIAERDALAAERHEPIAIVGIGCRLPGGADSPQAFWDLLDAGRDAVAPLDARWRLVGARPADDVPRWAGVLAGNVDEMDAAFFGISAREARSLDPQHRLLLEVAWEALDDAGAHPGDRLDGRRVGVFVGACSADYAHPVARQPAAELDAYATTGTMLSVAAGRVAYTFGFAGPTLTIDTACSSSLVAIHLACRSLRQREIDTALAGGVNMLLSPDTMAGLARLQALSPDGRCRTFDAGANGFVRGEGCGVLVLKRLSAAERDGDRIWAVIRGSAVNQDGRSTGLTAPNVLAQEALLRAALADARVDAAAIGFVETHGTGTSLGDPIEVEALRSVLGAPRADGSACVLGAVKTNVGHLEGGAGVVGVIKTVLAMQHERIPRNINFRTLNPRIRLDGSALRVASAPVAWPRGAAPRFAGVSSFGISGTNAHVIVQEAPAVASRAAVVRVARPQLVVVSAKSVAAARAQCERVGAIETGVDLVDIAYSLATQRSALDQRVAVVAADRDELRAALAATAVVDASAAARKRTQVAFVFSGQGSQVAGMGQGAYEQWPVFRDAFDRVIGLFAAELGLADLRGVIAGDATRLERTKYTQPALFAIEYALAALWRSWGVVPAYVAGHSIGEICAACIAGVFSVDDAVKLVAARARLMDALDGDGAMASIAASEVDVRAAIATDRRVEIAAVNGPEQIVIAGPRDAVVAACAAFARAKLLPVSHAFHSAQMDGMLDAFAEVAATVSYKTPEIPVVSNVTGAVNADVATPAYWVRHVRQTVRFADGVRALATAGVTTFVEIGPRPVLLASIEATLGDGAAQLLASLRPNRDDSRALLESLGAYWARGGDVAWAGVFVDGGERVALPAYAWQRERHWVELAADLRVDGEPTDHPLLGVRVAAAGRLAAYETVLDTARAAWLADHRVGAHAIAPAAAIAELVRAAGAHATGGDVEVRALVLRAPIALDAATRVHVAIADDHAVEVYGRAASAGVAEAWTLHATASIAPRDREDARVDLAAVRARCGELVDDVYARFAQLGLDYGAAFRGIARLWRGEREAIAELAPLALGGGGFGVAPTTLDAALQAVIVVRDERGLALPFELGAFVLDVPGGEVAWAHVRDAGDGAIDVALVGADGRRVGYVSGLRFRKADGLALRPPFYALAWRAAEAAPAAAASANAEVTVWSRGDGEDVIAAGHRIAREALAQLQGLVARGAAARWVTYRDDIGAVVWGLGRTALQEHPELDLRLIEIDRADGNDALDRALAVDDGEPQVRWRDGLRQVARLVRADADAPTTDIDVSGGTVVITGGLGALGAHVARDLAARGVGHLVLTGRRGLDTPGADTLVAELSPRTRVTALAIDVADRAALVALLAAIPADVPLAGIVHAAGVVDDALIAEQTAERIDRALAPKLDAAWHLHELTQHQPLALFALFSSLSGVLGAAGQANYAAANAVLDALAEYRRARGLVATSLQWGPWADAGMAARMTDAQQARLARHGFIAWSVADGVAQLAAAIARTDATLAAVQLDLAAAARAFGGAVPHVWRELVRPRAQLVADAAPAAALDVRALVTAEVARVLSFRGELPRKQPLSALGLDSLMAVELRNGLARRAGVTLPATLAFDYPTVDDLVDHLTSRLAPTAELAVATPAAAATSNDDGDDAIAIIGMGCRYPGGIVDGESFWRVLAGGVDAIGEMPPRWDVDALYDADPDAAGKMSSRRGGFVADIDLFDAKFFGISPREAAMMDPQQRLLLETTWEALEHGGVVPESLVGSDTGVFVGHMYQEYAALAGASLEQLDGYVVTGTAASVASGRLSYVLGLEGPSLTVDTACSSSLVTLHLACQALRRGECSLALAGGVALMLTPSVFVEFSRLRGLAPDGRCKSFGAGADGVGWAEGCGMLLLKRQRDAERDGDRILALVRGSAVNQDGRSNGLTAPNGPSQQAVIARALADAKVAAVDVDYVECHGTGTRLGDPIEAQALGAAYGERETPLVIGSVKSNLGHTQAAAGAAGVMKVILALAHEQIPASLHAAEPSPHVAWSELPLAVASEARPWLRNGHPRRAGVSSFGISGTNAHVIIEEPPARAAVPPSDARAQLLVLSGKTDATVRAQAARLAGADLEDLASIALGLATARTAFEQRAAIVARTADEARAALASIDEVATAAVQRGPIAFVFSGQGSQVAGIGKALYAEWPVFKGALDAALVHFAPELRDVMWSDQARLDRTGHTQPALFAIEYALAALWQSWGVAPAYVAGHSIGELVSACVAGVFSLDDAAKLVGARARLMDAITGDGAMASIAATEADVLAKISADPRVEIAAVNGPEQIVIAGPREAVIAACAQFTRTKLLPVSHAFHSAQMDAMLDAFETVASTITYRAPRIPVISNVTGAPAGDELQTPRYWVEHVRRTVRFADGIRALAAAGVTTFVEVGPRPVLLASIEATLGDAGAQLLASLRPNRDDSQSMLESLGAYWARGGDVAWPAVCSPNAARAALPTYAWQHEHHWFDPAPDARAAGEPTGHPLLGVRIAAAGRMAAYETTLDAARVAWLADHRVGDRAVVPAAAIAELARAAGTHALGQSVDVRALSLRAPIALDAARRVQIAVSDEHAIEIYSQPAGAAAADTWTLHATATIAARAAADARVDIAALRARCAEPVVAIYEQFATAGLDYGAAFRGIAQLWRGDGEAIAELASTDATDAAGFGVAPATLDAAMQAAIALRGIALPYEIDTFAVDLPGESVAWSHVRDTGEGVIDVTLVAADGRRVAELHGMRLRKPDELTARPPFYVVDWRAADVSTAPASSGVARDVTVWSRRDDEDVIAAGHRIAREALAQLHDFVQRGVRARWVTYKDDVAAAVAWGLGRVAMQEHPELDLRLIEIDGPGARDVLDRELAIDDGEPQVRWRDGRREIARLVRANAAANTAMPDVSGGTVVITGGLGALGAHVARDLAARGVGNLVLTGRRGMDTPGADALVAELSARTRVTVAAIDVADRDALAAMLATIPADMPLAGIVHAAGVVDDGVIAEQTTARFDRVLAPKLDAAWHLHELTADRPLAFFALFSSAAALFGAAGQSNYAAANAALDALAAHRRRRGLVATSLQWGPWADAGMAARLDGAQHDRLARQGLLAWPIADGIAQHAAALARPEAVLGAVRLDLAAAARAFAGAVPHLWRELVRAPRVAAAADRQLGDLHALVAAEIARVLSLRGDVPRQQPLSELGLDSLTAIELRNGLARRTGVSLPATLAFDYPTVDDLAAHLASRLAPAAKPAPVAAVATSNDDDDAIAIIGMGCRYPGGIVDGESFWRVLAGGVDAVAEMPPRWDTDALYDPDPDAAGKMITRRGGFVADIEQFDAGFFGISPHEAAMMDPQQRLLLETAWEALEHGGIVPKSLAGSDTGVFVGLMYQEYAALAGPSLDALDGYVLMGSTASVASGRLSYVLGLEGPSLTVDTACSSSLVTLHLACQALRRGECSLALAGGVALMLTPSVFVEFSRLRGLAPDGRCKSFGAGADGVGWAEGCGMLLLKRRRDAERDGDRILALVRGSAVNQDGRSNGLTAPNGPSQQAVIERALADAHVAAADVDYVECHGTGTRLGDPIEAQALGAAYGDREAPLVIGSVKSNLGHTQAAAGAAGVMKVILALQHGQIPASLHSSEPSPHVAWSELPLAVASEARPWLRNGHPRRAGVSSFGISGTNAHVIIEEPPARAAVSPSDTRAQLFVLSGKTDAAVRAQAARLADADLEDLASVALGLATTRTAFEQRAAIVARTADEARAALASIDEIATATARGPIAFVFSGQGSQVAGMGSALYAEWPVFRDALDAALVHLAPELRDVMWSDQALLDRTGHTQPALFAIEYALAALWQSWGVAPAYVAGHSIGELVSACVAGVFSLDDAAKLVGARARLMDTITGDGAMASIAATEADVLAKLGADPRVEIAAVNGPEQIVIAGPRDAVVAACAQFTRTKLLPVSHAFHSAQMDAMLDAFESVASTITYRAPRIPMISNVTGALAGAELQTPRYWVDHVRRTVRFADGIRALAVAGVTTFVEIGPRPVLLASIESLAADALLLPSLRPNRDDSQAMLESLGAYWTHGGDVAWPAVCSPNAARIALPTYAWQHQRHWVDARPATSAALLAAALQRLAGDDTLSAAARDALPELLAALAQSQSPDPLAAWFHAIAWRSHVEPATPRAAGAWLLLAPDPIDRDAFTTAFATTAATVHAVGDVAGVRAALASSSSPIRGVICTDPDVYTVLALVQALAAHPAPPRAWFVTRGAVSTGHADPVRAPHAAALWGVGRTVALELPAVWGGVIDVEPETAAARVVAHVASATAEDQLALRGDRAFVPRIVAASPTPPRIVAPFRTSGTALVTGGLGGLGLHVARWLADHGTRHLLLVSRRGLDAPNARTAVADLERRGAIVHVAAADAADRDAMAAALASLPADAPAISAVFHVAGLGDITALADLAPAQLAAVLAAKREGTEILEALVDATTLDAFVCFSSLAGVLGAARQAAYAASNALLDAWASAARARGVPALAVAWGPWHGDGLATAAVREHLAKSGLRAMSPARAMQALDRALAGALGNARASAASMIAIADVDWPELRAGYEALRPRPMLAEQAAAPADAEPSGPPPLVAALHALRPAARAGHMADWIAGECAAVLGHADASALARDRGFFDLGMDSLMAVKLAARLRGGLGIRVSPAVMFEQPNIAALAGKLLAELALPTAAPAAPAAPETSELFDGSDDDVLRLIARTYEEVV